VSLNLTGHLGTGAVRGCEGLESGTGGFGESWEAGRRGRGGGLPRTWMMGSIAIPWTCGLSTSPGP